MPGRQISGDRNGDETEDLDFSLLLSPLLVLLLAFLCGVITPVRERG